MNAYNIQTLFLLIDKPIDILGLGVFISTKYGSSGRGRERRTYTHTIASME